MKPRGKLRSAFVPGLAALMMLLAWASTTSRAQQAGFVLRVARQSLDNDKFIALVLGNPKNFDKPLDTLGKVTRSM